MIEYFQYTGLSKDSDDLYNQGNISFFGASIGNSNKFSNQVFVDGQTLLEDDFVETQISQQISTIENSGDYYLDGLTLKNSGSNYQFLDNEYLHYDLIESGKRPFFESSSFSVLITGFSGQVLDTLSGDFVFINGIKLTSGENYVENIDGNFEWIDSEEDFGGIIFSMPNSFEKIKTGQYDIFGEYFKKNTTVAYLNGVRLYREDFLETSTMASLIETGLENKIIFSPDSEEEIIFF